jgi:beta-fructofuranosidase
MPRALKKQQIILLMKKILFYLFVSALAYSVCAQESRVSKVPQYKYSITIEGQMKELESNPLLKRFKESRQQLSTDKHRPYYHFINPEGRLNDPNGLSFWNNEWHLFYQAYPPEDTRQHWGHAVSKDLIHWRDMPYAIYPDPDDKVFSGATLVEKDRVIAVYHGVGAGTMLATSSDPLLLNWEKTPESPVIPIAKQGETLPYAVFDPCIWKKDDFYYILTGGTMPTGPGDRLMRAEFLFRSKDLKEWQYMHPFLENDYYGLIGDDGACPYFWPIGNGDKYILLHFSHKSGGKYMIGDYDKQRDKFVVTGGGNFNHGPVGQGGVHAPSATPDGKGGVVTIFNMNSGKNIGNGNFTEIMTLPRLLTLDNNNDLLIQPVGDLESLRGEKTSLQDVKLSANKEIVLENIKGNAMEMNLEIDLDKSDGIELNVLRSPNKEEYTRILFYRNGGYADRSYPGRGDRYGSIAIDNSKGSLSPLVRPRVVESADVKIDKDETLKLRVFIDRSVIEVFVNDRQCVSVCTYPEMVDSKGVSIRALGRGDATLKSIDAWQMENIYR